MNHHNPAIHWDNQKRFNFPDGIACYVSRGYWGEVGSQYADRTVIIHMRFTDTNVWLGEPSTGWLSQDRAFSIPTALMSDVENELPKELMALGIPHEYHEVLTSAIMWRALAP